MLCCCIDNLSPCPSSQSQVLTFPWPAPTRADSHVVPVSSSNSTTAISASRVTFSASSTTACGTARDVDVFVCRLLASPGPGAPGPFAAAFLPPLPPPFTCTVSPLLLFPLLPLLLLPFAAPSVVLEESSVVSLRTSSRICRSRAGKVWTSPERRRARARFWIWVGQLFGWALRE